MEEFLTFTGENTSGSLSNSSPSNTTSPLNAPSNKGPFYDGPSKIKYQEDKYSSFDKNVRLGGNSVNRITEADIDTKANVTGWLEVATSLFSSSRADLKNGLQYNEISEIDKYLSDHILGVKKLSAEELAAKQSRKAELSNVISTRERHAEENQISQKMLFEKKLYEHTVDNRTWGGYMKDTFTNGTAWYKGSMFTIGEALAGQSVTALNAPLSENVGEWAGALGDTMFFGINVLTSISPLKVAAQIAGRAFLSLVGTDNEAKMEVGLAYIQKLKTNMAKKTLELGRDLTAIEEATIMADAQKGLSSLYYGNMGLAFSDMLQSQLTYGRIPFNQLGKSHALAFSAAFRAGGHIANIAQEGMQEGVQEYYAEGYQRGHLKEKTDFLSYISDPSQGLYNSLDPLKALGTYSNLTGLLGFTLPGLDREIVDKAGFIRSVGLGALGASITGSAASGTVALVSGQSNYLSNTLTLGKDYLKAIRNKDDGESLRLLKSILAIKDTESSTSKYWKAGVGALTGILGDYTAIRMQANKLAIFDGKDDLEMGTMQASMALDAIRGGTAEDLTYAIKNSRYLKEEDKNKFLNILGRVKDKYTALKDKYAPTELPSILGKEAYQTESLLNKTNDDYTTSTPFSIIPKSISSYIFSATRRKGTPEYQNGLDIVHSNIVSQVINEIEIEKLDKVKAAGDDINALIDYTTESGGIQAGIIYTPESIKTLEKDIKDIEVRIKDLDAILTSPANINITDDAVKTQAEAQGVSFETPSDGSTQTRDMMLNVIRDSVTKLKEQKETYSKVLEGVTNTSSEAYKRNDTLKEIWKTVGVVSNLLLASDPEDTQRKGIKDSMAKGEKFNIGVSIQFLKAATAELTKQNEDILSGNYKEELNKEFAISEEIKKSTAEVTKLQKAIDSGKLAKSTSSTYTSRIHSINEEIKKKKAILDNRKKEKALKSVKYRKRIQDLQDIHLYQRQAFQALSNGLLLISPLRLEVSQIQKIFSNLEGRYLNDLADAIHTGLEELKIENTRLTGLRNGAGKMQNFGKDQETLIESVFKNDDDHFEAFKISTDYQMYKNALSPEGEIFDYLDEAIYNNLKTEYRNVRDLVGGYSDAVKKLTEALDSNSEKIDIYTENIELLKKKESYYNPKKKLEEIEGKDINEKTKLLVEYYFNELANKAKTLEVNAKDNKNSTIGSDEFTQAIQDIKALIANIDTNMSTYEKHLSFSDTATFKDIIGAYKKNILEDLLEKLNLRHTEAEAREADLLAVQAILLERETRVIGNIIRSLDTLNLPEYTTFKSGLGISEKDFENLFKKDPTLILEMLKKFLFENKDAKVKVEDVLKLRFNETAVEDLSDRLLDHFSIMAGTHLMNQAKDSASEALAKIATKGQLFWNPITCITTLTASTDVYPRDEKNRKPLEMILPALSSFYATRDSSAFRKSLKEILSKLTEGEDKERVEGIKDWLDLFDSVIDGKQSYDLLQGNYNFSEVQKRYKSLAAAGVTPSEQQQVVVNQLLAFVTEDKSDAHITYVKNLISPNFEIYDLFSNIMLVSGSAGTGKSFITKILKELLPDKSYMFLGATKRATKNIEEIHKVQTANTLLNIDEDNFFMSAFTVDALEDKDIAFIDEYPFLSGEDQDHFKAIIEQLHKKQLSTGKSLTKFVLLGDPSQLSAGEGFFGNTPSRFSSSLLANYRSNVTQISNVVTKLIDVYEPVTEISGVFSTGSNGNSIGLKPALSEVDILTHLAEVSSITKGFAEDGATNYKRAILVANTREKDRIIDVLTRAGLSSVIEKFEILTVTDAQGFSFDEVYSLIDSKAIREEKIRLDGVRTSGQLEKSALPNKALYVAISRASKFCMALFTEADPKKIIILEDPSVKAGVSLIEKSKQESKDYFSNLLKARDTYSKFYSYTPITQNLPQDIVNSLVALFMDATTNTNSRHKKLLANNHTPVTFTRSAPSSGTKVTDSGTGELQGVKIGGDYYDFRNNMGTINVFTGEKGTKIEFVTDDPTQNPITPGVTDTNTIEDNIKYESSPELGVYGMLADRFFTFDTNMTNAITRAVTADPNYKIVFSKQGDFFSYTLGKNTQAINIPEIEEEAKTYPENSNGRNILNSFADFLKSTDSFSLVLGTDPVIQPFKAKYEKPSPEDFMSMIGETLLELVLFDKHSIINSTDSNGVVIGEAGYEAIVNRIKNTDKKELLNLLLGSGFVYEGVHIKGQFIIPTALGKNVAGLNKLGLGDPNLVGQIFYNHSLIINDKPPKYVNITLNGKKLYVSGKAEDSVMESIIKPIERYIDNSLAFQDEYKAMNAEFLLKAYHISDRTVVNGNVKLDTDFDEYNNLIQIGDPQSIAKLSALFEAQPFIGVIHKLFYEPLLLDKTNIEASFNLNLTETAKKQKNIRDQIDEYKEKKVKEFSDKLQTFLDSLESVYLGMDLGNKVDADVNLLLKAEATKFSKSPNFFMPDHISYGSKFYFDIVNGAHIPNFDTFGFTSDTSNPLSRRKKIEQLLAIGANNIRLFLANDSKVTDPIQKLTNLRTFLSKKTLDGDAGDIVKNEIIAELDKQIKKNNNDNNFSILLKFLEEEISFVGMGNPQIEGIIAHRLKSMDKSRTSIRRYTDLAKLFKGAIKPSIDVYNAAHKLTLDLKNNPDPTVFTAYKAFAELAKSNSVISVTTDKEDRLFNLTHIVYKNKGNKSVKQRERKELNTTTYDTISDLVETQENADTVKSGANYGRQRRKEKIFGEFTSGAVPLGVLSLMISPDADRIWRNVSQQDLENAQNDPSKYEAFMDGLSSSFSRMQNKRPNVIEILDANGNPMFAPTQRAPMDISGTTAPQLPATQESTSDPTVAEEVTPASDEEILSEDEEQIEDLEEEESKDLPVSNDVVLPEIPNEVDSNNAAAISVIAEEQEEPESSYDDIVAENIDQIFLYDLDLQLSDVSSSSSTIDEGIAIIKSTRESVSIMGITKKLPVWLNPAISIIEGMVKGGVEITFDSVKEELQKNGSLVNSAGKILTHTVISDLIGKLAGLSIGNSKYAKRERKEYLIKSVLAAVSGGVIHHLTGSKLSLSFKDRITAVKDTFKALNRNIGNENVTKKLKISNSDAVLIKETSEEEILKTLRKVFRDASEFMTEQEIEEKTGNLNDEIVSPGENSTGSTLTTSVKLALSLTKDAKGNFLPFSDVIAPLSGYMAQAFVLSTQDFSKFTTPGKFKDFIVSMSKFNAHSQELLKEFLDKIANIFYIAYTTNDTIGKTHFIVNANTVRSTVDTKVVDTRRLRMETQEIFLLRASLESLSEIAKSDNLQRINTLNEKLKNTGLNPLPQFIILVNGAEKTLVDLLDTPNMSKEDFTKEVSSILASQIKDLNIQFTQYLASDFVVAMDTTIFQKRKISPSIVTTQKQGFVSNHTGFSALSVAKYSVRNTSRSEQAILAKVNSLVIRLSDTTPSTKKPNIKAVKDAIQKDFPITVEKSFRGNIDEIANRLLSAINSPHDNAGFMNEAVQMLLPHSKQNTQASSLDARGQRIYEIVSYNFGEASLAAIHKYFTIIHNENSTPLENDVAYRSLPLHIQQALLDITEKDGTYATNAFVNNMFLDDERDVFKNTIHSIIGYQGQKFINSTNAVTQTAEGFRDFTTRSFAVYFLTAIENSIASSTPNKLTYMQQPCVESNHSLVKLYELDVKTVAELKVGIRDIIQGEYNRMHRASSGDRVSGTLNYFLPLENAISMEENIKFWNELKSATDKSKIARLKLALENILYAAIIKSSDDHLIENKEIGMSIVNKAYKIFDGLYTRGYLNGILGDGNDDAIGILANNNNAKETVKGDIEGDSSELDAVVRLLYRLYSLNQYVNRYNLDILTSGGYEFFKTYEETVKRQGSIHGSGSAATVNRTGNPNSPGMKPDTRIAVLDNWTGTLEINGVKITLKEQDDAGVFILPSYKEELDRGFSFEYNLGNTQKPVSHAFTKVNGKTTTNSIGMKCAGTVLTNAICAANPGLAQLRDAMEKGGVDIVAPLSAIKYGQPITTTTVNSTGIAVSINPASIITIDSSYIVMQSNPQHDPGASVAAPSQNNYAVGNDAVNSEIAKHIHNAFTSIFERYLDSVKDNSADQLAQIIKNGVSKQHQHVAMALIAAGVSPSLPSLVTESVIAIANKASRASVNMRFSGDKLTIQPANGFYIYRNTTDFNKVVTVEQYNKLSTEEKAKYKPSQLRSGAFVQDAFLREFNNGVDVPASDTWEVIAPQGLIEKLRRNNPQLVAMTDDEIYNIAFGIRIPTTGIGSGMKFKIVGTVPGFTTLISNPAMIYFHGSDFDVDSIFAFMYEMHPVKEGDTKPTVIGEVKGVLSIETLLAEKERITKLYNKERNSLKKIEFGKLLDKLDRNIIVNGYIRIMENPANASALQEPVGVGKIKSKSGIFGKLLLDVLTELRKYKEVQKFDGKKEYLKNLDAEIKFIQGGEEDSLRFNNIVHKYVKKLPLRFSVAQNLNSMQASFGGASLVGIFANLSKVYSYLNIYGNYVGNFEMPLKFIHNGKDYTYEEFSKFERPLEGAEPTGNVITWFNTFVNGAVDEVKERILQIINMTNETGPMWIVLTGFGLNTSLVTTFLNQPILRLLLDTPNIETIKKYADNIRITVGVPQLSDKPVINFDKISKYLLNSYPIIGGASISSLISKARFSPTTLTDAEKEFLRDQIEVLDIFSAFQKYTSSLNEFGKVLKTLKEVPVNIGELNELESSLREMFSGISIVDSNGYVIKTIYDIPHVNGVPYYGDPGGVTVHQEEDVISNPDGESKDELTFSKIVLTETQHKLYLEKAKEKNGGVLDTRFITKRSGVFKGLGTIKFIEAAVKVSLNTIDSMVYTIILQNPVLKKYFKSAEFKFYTSQITKQSKDEEGLYFMIREFSKYLLTKDADFDYNSFVDNLSEKITRMKDDPKLKDNRFLQMLSVVPKGKSDDSVTQIKFSLEGVDITYIEAIKEAYDNLFPHFDKYGIEKLDFVKLGIVSDSLAYSLDSLLLVLNPIHVKQGTAEFEKLVKKLLPQIAKSEDATKAQLVYIDSIKDSFMDSFIYKFKHKVAVSVSEFIFRVNKLGGNTENPQNKSMFHRAKDVIVDIRKYDENGLSTNKVVQNIPLMVSYFDAELKLHTYYKLVPDVGLSALGKIKYTLLEERDGRYKFTIDATATAGEATNKIIADLNNNLKKVNKSTFVDGNINIVGNSPAVKKATAILLAPATDPAREDARAKVVKNTQNKLINANSADEKKTRDNRLARLRKAREVLDALEKSNYLSILHPELLDAAFLYFPVNKKLIKQHLGDTGTKIRFLTTAEEVAKLEPKERLSNYNPTTNIITINLIKEGKNSVNVLGHEISHALTAEAIHKSPSTVAKINSIIDKLTEFLKEDIKNINTRTRGTKARYDEIAYGLGVKIDYEKNTVTKRKYDNKDTPVYEFVAQFTSSIDFIDFLRSKKLTDKDKGFINDILDFINSILEKLGLVSDYYELSQHVLFGKGIFANMGSSPISSNLYGPQSIEDTSAKVSDATVPGTQNYDIPTLFHDSGLSDLLEFNSENLVPSENKLHYENRLDSNVKLSRVTLDISDIAGETDTVVERVKKEFNVEERRDKKSKVIGDISYTPDEYDAYLRGEKRDSARWGTIKHLTFELYTHEKNLELGLITKEYFNKKAKEIDEKLRSESTEKIKQTVSIQNLAYKTLDSLHSIGINAFLETMTAENPIKDRCTPEALISNKLLNLGGTIDLLVQHSDNSYTLVDYKTGGTLFNSTTDVLKYSDSNLRATRINKASLQLVLYAMMIKLQNPNAKFRKLSVAHVQTLSEDVRFSDIDFTSFLPILQGYYKNKLSPEQFNEISSKGIFEVSSYTNDSYISEESLGTALYSKHGLTGDNLVDIPMLSAKVASLNRLINVKGRILKGTKEVIDGLTNREKAELKELTRIIAKLETQDEDIYLAENREGWLSRLFYSIHNVIDPSLKFIRTVYIKAKQKFLNEKSTLAEGLNLRLRALVAEKGLNQFSVRKPRDFYSFMEVFKGDEVSSPGYYLQTDQKVIDKFTKAQKDFYDYFVEHIHSTYKESFLVRDADGEVLVDKNKNLGFGNDLPELPPDFIPRIPASLYERTLREKSAGLWSVALDSVSAAIHSSLGSPLVGEFTRFGTKYMGDPAMIEDDLYTHDYEAMFKAFVEANLTKKHYDDALSIAIGVKSTIEDQKDPSREYTIQRINYFISNWFFGGQVETLGATGSTGNYTDKWTGTQYEKFTINGAILSGKVWVTMASLGFKPMGALVNLAAGMFANLIKATQGTFLSMVYGDNTQMMTLWSLTKAFADSTKLAGKYLMDKLTGSDLLKDDKTYQIIKTFNYLGDNYDYGGVTKSPVDSFWGSIFKTENMFFMQHWTENYIAINTLLAKIKTAKVKVTDAHGIISEKVWEDCYDMVNGKLVWTAGTRGIEKNGAIITDITDKEKESYRAQFASLHGAYNKDERMGIENWSYGQVLMLFKKYLIYPIMNSIKSAKHHSSEGNYEYVYEKTADGSFVLGADGNKVMLVNKATGIPYMNFAYNHERGMLRSFSKSLLLKLHWLPGVEFMSKKLGIHITGFDERDQPIANKMFATGLITIALMIGLDIISLMLFGGDDEDDKNEFLRVMKDIHSSASLGTMPVYSTGSAKGLLKDLTNMTYNNKMTKMFEGAFETGYSILSGDEYKLGKHKNELKGLFKVRQAIPILSSWESMHGAYQGYTEFMDK